MSEHAPAPGPHGAEGARLARVLGVAVDEVLDLSQSLNPVAPDVTPLVAAAASAVQRYPEPESATACFAAALGVAPERVRLTNGGAEAITLVARARPHGDVKGPEFSLYERHLGWLDPTGARWRSNPNNPTGALAAPDERAGVWDEAFYPLATGTWTRGDAEDGAIVVGSLTKLYACPGLRLGYVLAPDPELIGEVEALQPRWAVNGLALAVLPDLLARTDLPRWRAEVAALRAELVAALTGVGLCPEPSEANFVLVREAPGLREHLARRAIAVRHTGSFGIPTGVRIAVPDAEGLERVVAALGGGEW